MSFLGGGRRGHDYGGMRRVGRGGEVGVVHEGDVGDIVRGGREMELPEVSIGFDAGGQATYEAGIL